MNRFDGRLRVLINAASANMGGAKTYLTNVTRWLSEHAPGDEFFVYAPARTCEQLDTRDYGNVHFYPYPAENTGGVRRVVFDQITVPRLIRKHGANLLYSSTGFGTFRSDVPEMLLVRNPVYFDRLFIEKYRELGRSLTRNAVRRWLTIQSINSSDLVLFPTHAMQRSVEDWMDLSGVRAKWMHYGFDFERFAEARQSDSPLLRQIKELQSTGTKILLNVSTYAVHKNFETIVRALAVLKERGQNVTLLTTTAREDTSDKQEYDRLKRTAREMGVDSMWQELGYVSYDDLATVYSISSIFVFPSFTESFGHPLVESMAFGLPIVAGDAPVNREVCGEAGMYHDLFDPVDCAEKIMQLLQNDDVNARMKQVATDRAKEFSWSNYTKRLLGLFRELVENRQTA